MRTAKFTKKGFTIAEMLVALTITALLLTALATSINASMENLNSNEDIYKTINNARQVLNRMSAELRTSKGVAIYEDNDKCTFVNNKGQEISYWHWTLDDTTQYQKNALYLRKDSKDYLLCRNVNKISFKKILDLSDSSVVQNVQINMTVSYGDTTKTLSTAAAVMLNMP